jgi:hypothetical protein
MFYVYVLYRPWNDTPCYVGKGRGKRFLFHSKIGEKHPNKHLAKVFAKANRLGMQIKSEVVFWTSSEIEAFEEESRLILFYGRADLAKGTLCNHTNGGEGTSGIIISESRKSAISLVHRGKTIPEQTRAAASKAARERVWSEDSRKKISAAKKGKKKTPEQIAKMRLIKPSESARVAVAESNRKRVWTSEMRLNHSLRMKAVRKAKLAAGGAG